MQKTDQHYIKAARRFYFFKILAVLFCFLGLSRAEALSELSLATYGRSYPLSGSLDVSLGHKLVLWGQEKSWKNGYVRHTIDFSSAVVFNQVYTQLEFFPISIIGGSVGFLYADMQEDYDDFDCQRFQCKGNYQGTVIRGHLKLGYKKWFALFRYQAHEVEHSKTQLDFVYPDFSLIARPQDEKVESFRQLLVWRVSKKWDIVLAGIYSASEKREDDSTQATLNISHELKNWRVFAGGGFVESEQIDSGATFIGGLEWQLWE